MKILSVINLKGGVGKTISAVNIAYTLAAVFLQRVLLIDNDKQGNASKLFGVHSYDRPSMAEILTVKGFDINTAIRRTTHDCNHDRTERRTCDIDIIPANMALLSADKAVLLDTSRRQQTRLKNALAQVQSNYDFAVIDNAPDINMAVINALVASDDVIIPVKIDQWALDGLEVLAEQIETIKEEENPGITLRGCFATMYQRNKLNTGGCEWLQQSKYPFFNAAIRNTVKVGETTLACKPLLAYAPKCTAAIDYTHLTGEYLQKVSVSDTKEGQR